MNNTFKCSILIIIIINIFISCCQPSVPIENRQILYSKDSNHRGIVFMIDDADVEDFYKKSHYQYINNTGIKMTYFISLYSHLKCKKKRIIKQFQMDGHEIAFHGTHHINAVNYLKNHSIEDYLNYEIRPGLEAMKKEGLIISDFSYPYGAHTTKLDSILFHNYFYFIKLGSTSFHYYDRYLNKQIIHPFPLDRRYWKKYHLSIHDAIKLIDSAYKYNKIIMFYGHGLSDKIVLKKDKIWFSDFVTIFNYAKSKGFSFYRLEDLQKLNRTKSSNIKLENKQNIIDE